MDRTKLFAGALLVAACGPLTPQLLAQCAAFTYQGRLNDGGSPAGGARAADLDAVSQSGEASGGLVLSATENNALLNAGYVRIGTTTTADAWQQRVNGTPPAARNGHTAIWTGSEMIVWGGSSNT